MTVPDTREEAAAKLPALHILTVLGWNYLSPARCMALRGSERALVLEDVLRDHLSRHRFDHKGKTYPLSAAGIAQVLREITATGLSAGLIPANRAIYQHLTMGITVTEFVEGARASITVPLINWADINANRFQVTEEVSVERPAGMGRFRPDIVCYVNGLPLVVIEAKRPLSSTKPTAMVEEGISQHLRNQMGDGIQNLYAYSQLLLAISDVDGRYGTTNTAKKFWSSWREEDIPEAEMAQMKATPLSAAHRAAIFADRPRWALEDYDRLNSAQEAKRDAQEVVDFSEYEAQIRRMVDKQVIGQTIVEPKGVIMVGDLGQAEAPEDWSDEKTRTEADLIKTRIRKTIEQDLIDDPYAQRVFSELLKQAIREADALFDFPGKQFTMFKDLEAQVQDRATPGVPDRFAGRPMAQAFYGAFLETIGTEDAAGHTEDDLVAEAHHIDQAVDNAVQTYSINPGSIEGEIRRSLLPRYYKFFGGLEQASTLIEKIITVVRAGNARGRR